MPKKKSFDEQIAALTQEEEEIKKKLKEIRAKKKNEERKNRTKHLIQAGGIIYSILDREYIDGDLDRLAAFLKSQEERGKYFSRYMNNTHDNSDSSSEQKMKDQ